MTILKNQGQLEGVRNGIPPERGQATGGLGCCGDCEVTGMLTLEQLRLYGPLDVRERLKRVMPSRGCGQVLEFGADLHHDAAGKEG
jgi:hypothetical protein